MYTSITTALTVMGALSARLRIAWAHRGADKGASTLEMVILILGLITVATMLVAALTSAVRSRTDQIV
ncbi:MAG: hypothetical protein WCF04_15555 [Candidatus Nanopelagicales bacterium]